VIAKEEATAMGDIRIGAAISDGLVVIMLDHIMTKDVAAGDDAISDLVLLKRCQRIV